MTDTNPRPWHERVTCDQHGDWRVDGEYPSNYEALRAAKRGVLDEAHALAAEVERLRTLLATPADGPLRVERNMTGVAGRPHYLTNNDISLLLTDAEADAIESQLAARPAHDLPDGVQPWTADPIEIDGVPVVGVAMRDVVQGLPDDEWLRATDDQNWRYGSNESADWSGVYLLGRKPTPEPSTVTVELPQDEVEFFADLSDNPPEPHIDPLIAACRKALGR